MRRCGTRGALSLALMALLAAVPYARAAPPRVRVDVAVTEPASVFHLIDRLSDWRGADDTPDPRYLALWHAAVGDDPGDAAALATVRTLRRRYVGAVPPGGIVAALAGAGTPFPVTTERMRLEDKLALLFYAAPDWDAVWERAELLLTSSDAAALAEAMAHFRRRAGPVLRRAVHLDAYRARIAAFAAARPLAQFLSNIAVFLHVPSAPAPDLRVRLTWLPRGTETTRATVVERYAALEVPDGVALRHVLDVAVHETTHRLHERMPLAERAALERAFLSAPAAGAAGETGATAAGLFEEALATALGQGLFVRRFFPDEQDPQRRWYDDPSYDALAKAIEPVVARYVEAARPMDTAFVHAVVAAYADLVGAAGPPPRDLLRTAIVVATGSEARTAAVRALRTGTRPRLTLDYDLSLPDGAEGARAAVAAFRGVPVVVAVVDGERPILAAAPVPLDAERLVTETAHGPWLVPRPGAGPVLVLRAPDAASIESALAAYLARPAVH